MASEGKEEIIVEQELLEQVTYIMTIMLFCIISTFSYDMSSMPVIVRAT